MANTLNTEATGIFHSYLILRSAILEMIADLRRNPFLLDYVFAGLTQDTLTNQDNGQNIIDQAKKWFQSEAITVIFENGTNNAPKFPEISISLQGSQEIEQEGTLSDTHYQPFEDNDWEWPTIFGPFSATAYNAKTGVLTIPDSPNVLVPGMILVTRAGVQYPILDVPSDNSIQIAIGSNDVWDGIEIKSANPAYVTELESAVFREVHAIGCHVDSQPQHLLFLHSIMVWCLKRYNESLLEARGFERMTIASTDFKVQTAEMPEWIYSRYIQLTGSVRQVWPKTIAMKISEVIGVPRSVGTPMPNEITDADLELILNSDSLNLMAGKPLLPPVALPSNAGTFVPPPLPTNYIERLQYRHTPYIWIMNGPVGVGSPEASIGTNPEPNIYALGSEVFNIPKIVPNAVTTAIQMVATDGYSLVSVTNPLQSNLTFQVWATFLGFNGQQLYNAFGWVEFNLGVNNTGHVLLTIDNTVVYTGHTAIALHALTMLTVTKNIGTKTFSIYINGALEGTVVHNQFLNSDGFYNNVSACNYITQYQSLDLGRETSASDIAADYAMGLISRT